MENFEHKRLRKNRDVILLMLAKRVLRWEIAKLYRGVINLATVSHYIHSDANYDLDNLPPDPASQEVTKTSTKRYFYQIFFQDKDRLSFSDTQLDLLARSIRLLVKAKNWKEFEHHFYGISLLEKMREKGHVALGHKNAIKPYDQQTIQGKVDISTIVTLKLAKLVTRFHLIGNWKGEMHFPSEIHLVRHATVDDVNAIKDLCIELELEVEYQWIVSQVRTESKYAWVIVNDDSQVVGSVCVPLITPGTYIKLRADQVSPGKLRADDMAWLEYDHLEDSPLDLELYTFFFGLTFLSSREKTLIIKTLLKLIPSVRENGTMSAFINQHNKFLTYLGLKLDSSETNTAGLYCADMKVFSTKFRDIYM